MRGPDNLPDAEDLLALHDGRYWVIDWKSNHLGNRLEDYHEQALTAAMFEHDYVLQYHLYVPRVCPGRRA